jgi:hypothetical protein
MLRKSQVADATSKTIAHLNNIHVLAIANLVSVIYQRLIKLTCFFEKSKAIYLNGKAPSYSEASIS